MKPSTSHLGLLLVALTGCTRAGGTVEAQMIAADGDAGVAPRAPVAPVTSLPVSRALVRYHGMYVCTQGPTKLDLAVDGLPDRKVNAVFSFDFDGSASSPRPASGSYRMTGTYDPSSHRLALHATDWIEQPDGYEAVDIEGTVTKDGDTIAGSITHDGCSSFVVRRARTNGPE